MKPRVVVAPDFRRMDEIFSSTALARLHEHVEVIWGADGRMPQDEFEAALEIAEVVVFGTWHYGDAMKRASRRPSALLEVAGAHDHHSLDYGWCLENGVRLGSSAPAFGPAVAEMALALTLSSTRGVSQNDRDFRTGKEAWLDDRNEHHFSLFGRTVGMVGMGGISRHLQKLLAPFGVRVLGFDPFLSSEGFVDRGVQPTSLETMFETADVVYVLAAPTDSNRGLVSRELLERLTPRQVLVVVSRAHLVDFDALTQLVTAGQFRCATDVFPTEPLPLAHPLREVDDVVLSAHRAGAIPDALHHIGDSVVDDTLAIVRGERPWRLQYLTAEFAAALIQPKDIYGASG